MEQAKKIEALAELVDQLLALSTMLAVLLARYDDTRLAQECADANARCQELAALINRIEIGDNHARLH